MAPKKRSNKVANQKKNSRLSKSTGTKLINPRQKGNNKTKGQHYAKNAKSSTEESTYEEDQSKQDNQGSEEEVNPQQAKPKSEAMSNLVQDLYFGVAEKTVQESAYDLLSQYKPFNPDDLYQKAGDYSIYEEMLQDDQVNVCMQIKKDLVIGSGWDIIASSDDEIDQEIKEDVERALCEDLDNFSSFDDMLEEILSGYEFGFSLTEKIFKHRDDGSLTLKALKTRHPATWLIHTDKYGNVEKYEQRGRSSDLIIEPKSLIHYVNQRKFQNPYGTSDLRAAYNAYFIKRQIIRYYAIFLEKAASPTPIARYDKSAPQSAVDAIYNAIKKFQTKSALAIPKEIMVEFLESKSEGQVYTRGINIFNMFIGRSLFIPDLLGFQGEETSGGSYSLGKNQMEVLFKHINRRRKTLEQLVNKHIVYPLVVYNYGFVEHFPKFKLRPISDETLIELAKIWLDAVKGKAFSPNDEEINHFRKLAQFPEGEVEVPAPQPVPGLPGQPNPAQPMPPQMPPGSDMPEQDDMPESDDVEEEGDETSVQSDFSQKIYKQTKGDYYKKVDFKQLENHLDSFKDSVITEATPLVKKIFEDLYDQIKQKKIIKDVKLDRIDTIKVKYLKDLKLILKRNLREAYTESKKIAQKELLKGANYRTPVPDDAYMDVLDAETFQFIGDWSYNITKDARIAMMEAIRDGKPLSSLIDLLDDQGIMDSLVSLERFSRTKFTDVTNRGRLAFFNESGVVSAYQYSAILDDRTSPICSGLHGKIFKAGDEPVPPLHFNCRSILIPITKYEDFTVDETVGDTPIDQFIDENKGDGFSVK